MPRRNVVVVVLSSVVGEVQITINIDGTTIYC